MKKYTLIKNSLGEVVLTKTVSGLKQLAKKNKISEGEYQAICPGGNIHQITVKLVITKLSDKKSLSKVKLTIKKLTI